MNLITYDVRDLLWRKISRIKVAISIIELITIAPTTGGGIYYGLLCADIAVEVIHDALSADDCSGKRLSHYERGWKEKLSREIQIGYWARKIYEGLDDRQIENIFDIIRANNIHEAILQSPDFSFDWHGDSILRVLKNEPLARMFGH